MKRENGPGMIGLKNIMKEAGILEGKVGWDKSAVYPAEDGGLPVAQVAATQEYGDPTKFIPSRSFMRSTIAEKKTEWSSKMAKLAKLVIQGKDTVKGVFTKIVLTAEGDFVKKISTLQNPPLAQSTIDARLRKRRNKTVIGNLTKPLVDSGYMLATLDSTVNGVKVK